MRSVLGALVLGVWLGAAGAAPAAELVAAKGTDVTSFDPGINPTPDAQQVITMIYDTLIQRDDNMQLKPGLAVSVDTQLARFGLSQAVSENSEVHFLPAISGGTQ